MVKTNGIKIIFIESEDAKSVNITTFNVDKAQYVFSYGNVKVSRELLCAELSYSWIAVNGLIENGEYKKIILNSDSDAIYAVCSAVRRFIEKKYGTGTDICGTCIEASEYIAGILHYLGYKDAKTVEGWVTYDDERLYPDAHTWVELDGQYLDVTADQFNTGMDPENEFPPILINDGLPYGMSYLYSDDAEDEAYWDE